MNLDIQKYKDNPRTAYLAETFERLSKEEEETKLMAGDDAEMQKLAEEELSNLKIQKDEVWKQIEDITSIEEKEEEFPNEIILEVRAGAGGDEASLFALDLATMYQRYFDKMKLIYPEYCICELFNCSQRT